MHTIYIDKPMHGHGLMQAIAWVKSVFEGKPGGLVVGYIGIGQSLQKALQNYTAFDRERTGINEEEAVAALQEQIELCHQFFEGHDYSAGIAGIPGDRLVALADAIEWALDKQKPEADSKEDSEHKLKALNHYRTLMLRPSKGFTLASTSDSAQTIKEEVAYFRP